MKQSLLVLFGLLLFPLNPEATAEGRECFDMDSVACEVFHRTNHERASAGLPALAYNGGCFRMAQDQSEDMLARGYFSHRRPATGNAPGESFTERAKRFGLKNWIGENIARNGNAAGVVGRWMNSPGHRKNILNPKYNSFGVGYREGYYTQVFWRDPSLAKK